MRRYRIYLRSGGSFVVQPTERNADFPVYVVEQGRDKPAIAAYYFIGGPHYIVDVCQVAAVVAEEDSHAL